MRAAALGALTCLALTFVTAAHAETVAPGKDGQELLAHLRKTYFPRTSLSYRQARQEMFTSIDNQDGFVRLVYTGRPFRTNSIPNSNEVNTEHTWPQSMFKRAAGKAIMKTDLHHLFPTYASVNGERGHKAFDEIPNSSTQSWWNESQARYDQPSNDIDDYSEATDDLFEPREDHKGNVARALAYFYSVYGGDNIEDGWFLSRIETLRQWHEQDPVDERELARTQAISAVQGNVNPFVVDPSAFERVFFR